MTRLLTFDGDRGPTRFLMCYTAILNAGDGKGERSRAVIRKEARLLDLFDQISGPGPSAGDRVLRPEGGEVTLMQEDFDLLSLYLDTTAWIPRASRDAVDVQDWLSASAKRD